MSELLTKQMNQERQIKGRQRRERRFRLYCVTAIGMACAFLVFFFANLIYTGSSAFLQAEILVDVNYTEQAKELPLAALDEDTRYLVSRGWLRLLPGKMEDSPALLGTTESLWVLADAEVDQYMKGKANRLKRLDREVVDRLQARDRAKLVFNTYLFSNGDSKMPELAGIFSAAVGSCFVLFITLVVSFPIGVMTAVYLEEYARDNRLTQAIEVNINNLAAIPSILFGLLGLAIIINFFGVPRSSALAGGLTLALMTLPVIIISSRAALRAVPDSIRQGALGVGASQWQTIWHHVLPLSLPGMLTGTIIGIAQAMGETAPLLIVGMMAFIPEAPDGFTDSATVLPAQIYTWASESLRAFESRTAAAILILMAVLLTFNATAVLLRKKFQRRW